MILADTAIWLQYLRSGNEHLAELLTDGRLVVHPAVVGELACCPLEDRATVLSLVSLLPGVRTCEPDVVLRFIDRHRLHERGLGLVDAQLLAATVLSDDVRLWTEDPCLRAAAVALGCSHLDDESGDGFLASLPSLPVDMNPSAFGRR